MGRAGAARKLAAAAAYGGTGVSVLGGSLYGLLRAEAELKRAEVDLRVTISTTIAARESAKADLAAADLEPVLALQPEILLIGSGERQVFPVPELLAALYAARLGFEIMATGAACRTYNVLVAEGREVAAALLIE